jgi:hypothetical protein
MTIEQRRAFCADALSSEINLNVDLDVVLAGEGAQATFKVTPKEVVTRRGGGISGRAG